jgi:hypothetical protein
MLSRGITADLSKYDYHGKVIEKDEGGRTEKEEKAYRSLCGGRTAASLQTEIRSPQQCLGKEQQRRRRGQRCRTSVRRDAGVKEDDGGGAGSPVRWFRRRRARGRRERSKKKEWGVKR